MENSMNKNDIDRLVAMSYAPINDWWLDQEIWPRVSTFASARIRYYRFLYHLVRVLKPEVCIELGVEYGGASAHMARAAQVYGGIVIGVDHNKHELPDRVIPRMCENYVYEVNDTLSAWGLLNTWDGVRGHVGLVFQDSSHHYAPSVEEFELYSQFLAPGAVWVCDDITKDFFEEGVDEFDMVKYFDDLPGEHIKIPDVLHIGNTIGVILL
jgi:cephalosporin hydroxylase